jgi:cyclic pyranopterin phosphate synthase
MPEDDAFKGRALAKSKATRLAPKLGLPGAIPPSAPPARPAPPGSAAPAPVAPARVSSPEAAGRMADVGAKPVVPREATAEGFVRLQAATLKALREGAAPKGDPFPVARVAGIMAAKRTPDLVPLCHPIPLTSVEVDLSLEGSGVRCRATVKAEWKTGVEMEALAAVTAALLTVWDMTKALEKDETGNYPHTAIEGVRVASKTKGVPS